MVQTQIYLTGRERDEQARVFPVERVTLQIARADGRLRAEYARSKSAGLGDALVAAAG